MKMVILLKIFVEEKVVYLRTPPEFVDILIKHI